MQTLTLSQLFGVNAVQTGDQLIIRKSDLAATGLTPSANNTAESLLVALVLQALENFQGILTDENNQRITDENGNSLMYDNHKAWGLIEIFKGGLYIPNELSKIRQEIIIHFYELP